MDDECAHPSKPDPETPTPEVAQLLKLLELQAAAMRQHGRQRTGKASAFQGASFRYGSLILIVVFALGSVAAMEWMLSQLPKPPAHAPPAASVSPVSSYKN